MRLLKPKAEILYVTPNAPQVIERCGRVCYKSEDGITPTTAARFVKMLYDKGHHSVLEHASATVKFTVDRGVSHEFVRHRVASFSQESSRYVSYATGGKVGCPTFIIPCWVDIAEGEYKLDPDFDYGITDHGPWLMACLQAEFNYNKLIANGWKPEQARSVLPNSLKTELILTANAREWLHIIELRTAPAAHPQMREVMNMVAAKLQLELFGQILHGIH